MNYENLRLDRDINRQNTVLFRMKMAHREYQSRGKHRHIGRSGGKGREEGKAGGFLL